MSYKIFAIPEFERELKKLVKKYSSLKTEIKQLVEQLRVQPKLGTHLGSNVYKIRIAVASKGKGKSGGARIITYVEIKDKMILLLSIYSKGDQDSISKTDIHRLIERYLDQEDEDKNDDS